MMVLGAVYGEADVTRMDVYFTALKGALNDEAFKRACSSLVVTHKRSTFPTPHDILQASGTHKDVEMLAIEAWAKFEEAHQRHAQTASIVFDDPLIHVVVDRLGGWGKLGLALADEWPFIAKDFQKIYKLYAVNPPDITSVPPVLLGPYNQAPIYFGDYKKCKQWLDEQTQKKQLSAKSEYNVAGLLDNLTSRTKVER
jgi:hypothetical protein